MKGTKHMITDAIKKKINHRDNLLADYHKDLTSLSEKMKQNQAKLEAAIEAADFKRVAQLEREACGIQIEIDDINKAIGWATEKLALPKEFIKEQWKVREAEHQGKVEKARAAADKAYEAFIACLQGVRTLTSAAATELDEYNELLFDEDLRPDKARTRNRMGMSIEDIPAEALYREYAARM